MPNAVADVHLMGSSFHSLVFILCVSLMRKGRFILVRQVLRKAQPCLGERTFLKTYYAALQASRKSRGNDIGKVRISCPRISTGICALPNLLHRVLKG